MEDLAAYTRGWDLTQKIFLSKDLKNEPKENLKLIYKIRNEEKHISEDN